MPAQFLDTNVLLRHLLQDVPDQSRAVTEYLAPMAEGITHARIADTVVFETVFTLERTYKISKAEIRDAVDPMLQMPGIDLPGKRRFRQVFDYYVDLNISFADAYHVVMMQQLGIDEIVSFDRGLDRVPSVTRIEPPRR